MNPPKPSPKQKIAALVITYLAALKAGPGLNPEEYAAAEELGKKLAKGL